jgi:hypothetical protein
MRDKCARKPDQVPLTGTLCDSEKEKSQSEEVSRIFSSQQEKLWDRIVTRTKPVLTNRRGSSLEGGFRRGTQGADLLSATSAWISAASAVNS